ncbi:AAA family ATPase [Mycobacterium vicinigordonae]|uniref:AAA family ATPase n=1 Tax=Mycobacterium vicinigordonae TaxID=1719132 RepID=UPI001FE68E5B|nr:AAA family ATPase [Mycobacterium vicinigordonae]
MIDRVEELGALESFLDGGGPCGGMLLRGEAGVGKSMLVQELSDRAAARGRRVLRCSGVEAEASFVLAGLSQLVYPLRDFIGDLGIEDQRTLQTVLGVPSDKAPSVSGLTFALLNLLTAAGDVKPLLVALDDAHWFDDVSARVIAMAGRRLDVAAVRLIAACRAEVPNALADGGWPQLMLGPFDAEYSASFLDELGVDLTPTARLAVLDQAAGNPLALEELSRCALENAWTHEAPLPLTQRLVAIFGERLKSLDAATKTELLRGALDGPAAPDVMSAPPRNRYVMEGIEAAVESGILIIDSRGEMVFRHPLVRAAVIQASSAIHRRAAHALLADIYPDDLVRRAAHLADATVGPDQAVADTLAKAAEVTIRRGGARQAIRSYRRAAELCEESRRREELLADAAFVALQAAQLDEAERLLADVDLGARASRTAVLTSSFISLYRYGDVTATHRYLVERLQSGDDLDRDSLTRMVNLLLAANMFAADPVMWGITDTLVDSLASRLGELTLIYRDAWADVARRGHGVRQRLDAQLNRLPELDPWDLMRLGLSGYYVDVIEDFRPALTRMVDREIDGGAATIALATLALVMVYQIATGQWAEALRSGQRGVSLCSEHHYGLFGCQFRSYLGLLAAHQGNVERARAFAAEVRVWAEPRRVGFCLGNAQQIAVLCSLAEGDYESAYLHATAITAVGEFPPYSLHAPRTLFDLVEAAVHTDRLAEARQHLQAAERLKFGYATPRLAIAIGAAAALCASDELAPALFEKTLRHPDIAAFPFEHARVRLAYGMRLRRLRRYSVARVVLDAAEEIFSGLGAEPWAQRARSELRAAGTSVHHSATGGPAPLSAQERRIAELAAKGLTNKEIARQMSLSPRTVGAHLYRLFPKLGVTRRAGLHDALKAIDAAPHTIGSSD